MVTALGLIIIESLGCCELGGWERERGKRPSNRNKQDLQTKCSDRESEIPHFQVSKPGQLFMLLPNGSSDISLGKTLSSESAQGRYTFCSYKLASRRFRIYGLNSMSVLIPRHSSMFNKEDLDLELNWSLILLPLSFPSVRQDKFFEIWSILYKA